MYFGMDIGMYFEYCISMQNFFFFGYSMYLFVQVWTWKGLQADASCYFV